MLTIDGKESCFDIELMRLICGDLGLARRPVDYTGTDFDGIFGDLGSGSYAAVISGATITPERVALFSDPYLESEQGLVVNAARNPQIRSIEDLTRIIHGIASKWGKGHGQQYRKSRKPIMTGKPIPGAAQTCLLPASRVHPQTTRSKLPPARAQSLLARTRARWPLRVLRPDLPRRRP